jgi:hypothetical protein
VASLFAIVSTAAGSPRGGECQLQGTASFATGLNSSSQAFNYSFGGNLSSCQSSESGAPTSGAVSAGQTVTKSVVNSITGLTDTVTYQEPVPSGTGSCATSTTSGQAVVTWADGSTTVESYSTKGAAAAVVLTGSVQSSMTLAAVNAAPGDPSTITIATTRYAGESTGGALAFQPPDPTACNTSAGVKTAGISGVLGLGSQS